MSNQLNSRLLRIAVRKNSSVIIDNITERHIKRNKNPSTPLMCVFCGSTADITKEHVLPRWLFEKDTRGFFITDVNGLKQTYNKTTIPACTYCNSNILNDLEKNVSKSFENIDLKKKSFNNDEIENIIRWLEIIDYKFQILDVKREFKASKQGSYIPYLTNFPISVLRASVDYSPTKVVAEIRRSQKRISIKGKSKNINSLVTFKTSNPSFHFFHQMNDFIFIELPRQQIALFYFYTKIFHNETRAHTEAMTIINKIYK